ncbi:hypothetical protein [Patiriisocius hiemis]|uniref:TonB C-terminal domain-containing protein n=1 Tax=Patiriisocius hiemis TaxID=3075604 RepID=A0ABU2Y8W3_9FLAO|nr:hypothetical protein [Constantimarinum sp. W242]MDT0554615.1 hypothetical protein [Constantimarinum sp. W242]
MNRIICLISFLFFAQIAIGQIDEQTQNKIKVKYLSAKADYKTANYWDALEDIKEIEALTDGQKVASVQNLKVKCYIGIEQYDKAKKGLNALYAMNPSSKILKDIASYEGKIDSGIKAEIKRKEEVRLEVIEKELELERKKEIKKASELNKDKYYSFNEIDKGPIFPGCVITNNDLKKCFHNKVTKLINKKFDIDILNQIQSSSGQIKLGLTFTIDYLGNIINIKGNTENEILNKELVRIGNFIPKRLVPGEINGIPVNVNYSLLTTIYKN